MPWSRAAEALGTGALAMGIACFLGTVRPDGRPHAAAVGGAVEGGEGVAYVVTGQQTRKGRNLAANPACTLSVRVPGMDIVIEGQAQRVTDADTLERAAAMYRAGGWPCEVEGDELTAPYSAQSAGPAPWSLYRIPFGTVFGVATSEPYGATRWRFA
jgi:hypothetical protein